MTGFCNILHIYICVFQRCRNFKTDRFLSFLVIEKYSSVEILCQWIRAHSSSILLSSQPLRYPLEGYLLPSSEIHEISRNPNAQFSASIFSGIPSTYVSSSCSSCNMCACTCKCMPSYVYVQACPGAIERVETPRNERTNERGKIVDSMGLMTLARQSDCRQLFHDRNSFCRLNNLKG